MKAYPIRKGLIVPPYELGYTKPTPEQQAKRGATTNHHGYYPGRAFRDVPHRRIFRNLVSNVYPMIGVEHNIGADNLHNRFAPPPMPKDVQMIDVVEEYLYANGVIDCVRENKTHELIEISYDQWQLSKGLYRRVA